MLEIGPGVYTAPSMTRAVRDRVWAVLESWFDHAGGGSVIMTWQDSTLTGGQSVKALGSPPYDIVDLFGVYIARKRVADSHNAS